MALDDDEVTCVKSHLMSFVLLPSDLQRSSSKDVFKGQMSTDAVKPVVKCANGPRPSRGF